MVAVSGLLLFLVEGHCVSASVDGPRLFPL